MRTWILPLAVLAALVLIGADPAWAADGEAKGLQFDKQLTLVTIGVSIGVFLLLLIVLGKFAWKPILAGLQQREDTIRKALDDAEEAHNRAKALIAEYEAKIDKAREEAQAVFDEARRDADEIRTQIEANAKLRASETVERAQREIGQLTAKAWDGFVKDAASIATEAAGRIIKQELTADGHAAIVASVVTEVAARSANLEASA